MEKERRNKKRREGQRMEEERREEKERGVGKGEEQVFSASEFNNMNEGAL